MIPPRIFAVVSTLPGKLSNRVSTRAPLLVPHARPAGTQSVP